MAAIQLTHVVASLAERFGGPSYSVPALAAGLARGGAIVRLRSVDVHGSTQVDDFGVERVAHPMGRGVVAAAVRASQSLNRALTDDARSDAILHCHGLWLMPNVYTAWAKQRSNGTAKLVHAPRGMLGAAALNVSTWKKEIFWSVLQRRALEVADCMHATSEQEYTEIRSVGLNSPVAIIPNGIELPNVSGVPRNQDRGSVVLSLGRIHPKKGLDRLVHAWAQIEKEYPSWSLRIVGPAENGHDKDLWKIAQAIGTERLSIEGAIYGEAKLVAYRAADLFVLPTLNDNFAMTVGEALAAEVPVISTKGAPWSGLNSNRCGWWIDHGVPPLAAALREAMAQSRDELRAMGDRGRSWVGREFSWYRASSEMLDVYRWLKGCQDKPSNVRLD